MAQTFPLNTDLPADPAWGELDGMLAGLPDDWTVLRERRVGGLHGAYADFVLVHPQIGVAVVDLVPGDPQPAVDALRRHLGRERFSEFYQGFLPVVGLSIADAEIASVGDRLAEAFERLPELDIADGEWAEAVVELLLTPQDMTMASIAPGAAAEPPPRPEPPPVERPAGAGSEAPSRRGGQFAPWLEDAERRPPRLIDDEPAALPGRPARRWRVLAATAAGLAIIGAVVVAGTHLLDDLLPGSEPDVPIASSEPARQQPLQNPPVLPQRATEAPAPPAAPPAPPPAVTAAKPMAPPPAPAPALTRVDPLPPPPPPAAAIAAAPPATPPAPPTTQGEQKPPPAGSETAAAKPPASSDGDGLAPLPPPPKPTPPARVVRSEPPKPPPRRMETATAAKPPSPAPKAGGEARVASRQPAAETPPLDAGDLPPLPGGTPPSAAGRPPEPANTVPPAAALGAPIALLGPAGSTPAPPPPAAPPPASGRPQSTGGAVGPPVPLLPPAVSQSQQALPGESEAAAAPDRPMPAAAARPEDRQCRPYTSDTTLMGQRVPVRGMACRETDGRWHLVSELPLR